MRTLMVTCLLLVAVMGLSATPEDDRHRRPPYRPHTTSSTSTTNTKPSTKTTAATTITTTATTTTNPSCRMSTYSSAGRIVGGIPVTIDNYPYQLSFRYNGAHFCGASIISPGWAVTAAHCCIYAAASLTLKAGSATRSTGGTVHKVLSQIPHSSYNDATHDYDIALLKLDASTPFIMKVGVIEAIALPTAGSADVPANTNSTVSGWGTMASGASTLPDQLQAVAIPVVSQASCQASYGSSAITPRMMCAGLTLGGKDSCQGDSGGPLIAMVCGKKQLIGVVSWGYSCAQPNYPGVYASVANLRTWISTNSGI